MSLESIFSDLMKASEDERPTLAKWYLTLGRLPRHVQEILFDIMTLWNMIGPLEQRKRVIELLQSITEHPLIDFEEYFLEEPYSFRTLSEQDREQLLTMLKGWIQDKEEK